MAELARVMARFAPAAPPKLVSRLGEPPLMVSVLLPLPAAMPRVVAPPEKLPEELMVKVSSPEFSLVAPSRIRVPALETATAGKVTGPEVPVIVV